MLVKRTLYLVILRSSFIFFLLQKYPTFICIIQSQIAQNIYDKYLLLFDNILEASTCAFYIKIMCFASFLRVQIHCLECQRFVNLAVHFIRARSSLIQYQAAPRLDEVDCKVHETRFTNTEETREKHNRYIYCYLIF